MKLNADIVLVSGLLGMTVGMALIVFGIVLPALFFAGVYLLAGGLGITAVGAVLRLFQPATS